MSGPFDNTPYYNPSMLYPTPQMQPQQDLRSQIVMHQMQHQMQQQNIAFAQIANTLKTQAESYKMLEAEANKLRTKNKELNAIQTRGQATYQIEYRELKKAHGVLQDEKSQLLGEKKTSNATIKALSAENARLQTLLDSITKPLAKTSAQFEILGASESLQRVQALFPALESSSEFQKLSRVTLPARHAVETEIAGLKKQIKTLERRNKGYGRVFKGQQKRVDGQQQRINDQRDYISRLKAEMGLLTAEKTESEENKKHFLKQIATLEDRIATLEAEKSALKLQTDILVDQLESPSKTPQEEPALAEEQQELLMVMLDADQEFMLGSPIQSDSDSNSEAKTPASCSPPPLTNQFSRQRKRTPTPVLKGVVEYALSSESESEEDDTYRAQRKRTL